MSRRFTSLCSAVATLATLVHGTVAAAQRPVREQGPLNQYGNPMKIPPRPTKAAIDEADLRSRLYIFADDSMLGRQINAIGNKKGTDYIAAELKRMGIEPAGDNGTYFQVVPFASRYYNPESFISSRGTTFKWGSDVVATPGGTLADVEFRDAQVIYGGVAGDTTRQIAPGLAIGRVVLLSAAAPVMAAGGAQEQGLGGRAGGGGGGGAEAQRAMLDSLSKESQRLLALAIAGTLDSAGRRQLQIVGQQIYNTGTPGGTPGGARGGGGRGGAPGGGVGRFAGALAVLTIGLDNVPVENRAAMTAPPQRATLQNPAPPALLGQVLTPASAPPTLMITNAVAEELMGAPLAGLVRGAAGRRIGGRLTVASRPSPNPDYARNVVAIIRGSDPVLRNEYVAIGAHSDHVGLIPTPVDHDSVRALFTATYKLQMADGKTVQNLTPAMRDSASKLVDWAAMRKRAGAPRPDSVRNGADDDGSGSMALLEIAEALMSAPVKPKRSMILIWHTGEESGLQGSAYFSNYPTVPRESIVAQLNIDMIGRGRADDLPGGGPDYLAVVGSNRLSSDLSKMVSDVNGKQPAPLKLDYQFDEPSLWGGYNNIYGRSDHWNYARYNIPIAFFFTGLHRDYHQVTDEPQYIDYPHYTRITRYIHELALEVGNAATRPKVDRPSM